MTVPVRVEVVILAAEDGVLTFRAAHQALPVDHEPDAVARAACVLPPACDGLLHSTSWRYDAGHVILTYAEPAGVP